jgi:NO-binding membrane sensor protein with MHYT domain
MALNTELMACGMQAEGAKKLGYDTPATGLTATGSTQGSALALTSTCSIFSTVSASTGAVLSSASKPAVVYNGGASTLTVYPPGTFNFLGLSASVGISVPANKSALFIPVGTQIVANISA